MIKLIYGEYVSCFKGSLKKTILKIFKKWDLFAIYIFFLTFNIFYTTTAFFWAITFENPSINEEMAAIWNFLEF